MDFVSYITLWDLIAQGEPREPLWAVLGSASTPIDNKYSAAPIFPTDASKHTFASSYHWHRIHSHFFNRSPIRLPWFSHGRPKQPSRPFSAMNNKLKLVVNLSLVQTILNFKFYTPQILDTIKWQIQLIQEDGVRKYWRTLIIAKKANLFLR